MSGRKRVFITGASSLLIQKMLTHVDFSKFEIIGLSRQKITDHNETINWVIGDILEPDSYRNSVAQCDMIIHAAAITHSRNPSAYFKVNVEGTKQLIKSIPEGKNPPFILISSRVAGSSSGAYGLSKLQAENEVKTSSKNWMILRPSEIYGGSSAEGIEKTIQSALSGGLQLCPVGEKSKMYPIHISDAAEKIYRLAFVNPPQNVVEYINGGVGYTFKELLKMIESFSKNKMTIVEIPQWFLNSVGRISGVIPFNIGFVPDQVARLFSKKDVGPADSGIMKIEEYIKSQKIK